MWSSLVTFQRRRRNRGKSSDTVVDCTSGRRRGFRSTVRWSVHGEQFVRCVIRTVANRVPFPIPHGTIIVTCRTKTVGKCPTFWANFSFRIDIFLLREGRDHRGGRLNGWKHRGWVLQHATKCRTVGAVHALKRSGGAFLFRHRLGCCWQNERRGTKTRTTFDATCALSHGRIASLYSGTCCGDTERKFGAIIATKLVMREAP